MKHLLNTLYVTTQGAYLTHEGEALIVRVEQETKFLVPIHTLAGVVCFGRVSMSPPLMELCADRGVGVSFFSERGRFFARVEGGVSGNVLLRRQQYRRADDEVGAAAIARSMLIGKIANCRTVLLRALRDHPESSGRERMERSSGEMSRAMARLVRTTSLDEVRGIEGLAASLYFDVFDHLVVCQKEDFFFNKRSRRPPLDRLNALLSFIYTLLVHDTEGALEGVGLDPSVGFLHRDRPGRAGLALDLMEELRPVLGDRLALSLINRGQVTGARFLTTETGAVWMDADTRKEVLVAWQKRKQEVMIHPFLGERIATGLVPHVQALLLARHLRGDLDAYPPFVWK